MLCSCGCGQWAPDCRDERTAGRWQAHTDTCYAGAAIDEFRSQHGDDLEAGAVVYLTLLPEGEQAQDLVSFDPERAAAAYAEHAAKFGLA